MDFKLTKEMYRPNLNIKLLLSNAELLIDGTNLCDKSCLDCPLASVSVKQEFGSICDMLSRMAEEPHHLARDYTYRARFKSLKIKVAKQFIELFGEGSKYTKINLTE